MTDDSRLPTSNQRLVEALQRAEDARILRQGNYDLTLAEQDRAVLVAELERLREENQSLRNLANNLRPGPISQALQDSPDYSGQTIERLRAALEKIAEFDCRPYEHVGELKCWSCYANDALSDDSQSCTCRKLPEPPSDDYDAIDTTNPQPQKGSDRPVCNKCQTPMRLAQTDYGMGWQLDCACKDGGPAKREPDNVDCGNPVMVNAERYGPCTLPSGHDGDCKRTSKETVPRSDESQRMPFQKTSPRTLNEPERNAINRAADASVEVVDPGEITHGKDCQCGLCKHAHDL